MFVEITFYTSLSNIMLRCSILALFSHFLVAIFPVFDYGAKLRTVYEHYVRMLNFL